MWQIWTDCDCSSFMDALNSNITWIQAFVVQQLDMIFVNHLKYLEVILLVVTCHVQEAHCQHVSNSHPSTQPMYWRVIAAQYSAWLSIVVISHHYFEPNVSVFRANNFHWIINIYQISKLIVKYRERQYCSQYEHIITRILTAQLNQYKGCACVRWPPRYCVQGGKLKKYSSEVAMGWKPQSAKGGSHRLSRQFGGHRVAPAPSIRNGRHRVGNQWCSQSPHLELRDAPV